MDWSKEALEIISKVPFFVRSRVKKRVEEEARQSGSNTVLTTHVRQVQKRFLNNMESEILGYRIESCFGLNECPNSVINTADLVGKLEQLFRSKNLLDFLKRNVPGPLKFHHEFRVAIANCPNACSRPQIVDIGIIGAMKPQIADLSECSLCEECVQVCEENALQLKDNVIVLHERKCLGCGQCIRKCPTESIKINQSGYRVLLGGKLGRHPQLGEEVPFLLNEDEVVNLVNEVTALYMNYVDENSYIRFGDFTQKIGVNQLLQELFKKRPEPFESPYP